MYACCNASASSIMATILVQFSFKWNPFSPFRFIVMPFKTSLTLLYAIPCVRSSYVLENGFSPTLTSLILPNSLLYISILHLYYTPYTSLFIHPLHPQPFLYMLHKSSPITPSNCSPTPARIPPPSHLTTLGNPRHRNRPGIQSPRPSSANASADVK
jgi:hypothetical protein